ncbi:MarR family transcriptional regulator [Natrinema sp. DC36]|uniref:MarR family transcriptional regulator n=1 Tax=Natrinema sp. DC36 TaxID=2878680 RepID=UPI001CF0B943|nr:MarR family transcriptional regulator [Natrinema sp. DC36]
MLMQDAKSTDRLSPLPTELDSAQSKLVYVTLEATDGATTEDLSRLLNMQKLTILSVLSSLSSQGLIEETGSAYVVAN